MKTIQFGLILFAMVTISSCNRNGQLRHGEANINFEPCWTTAGSVGTVDERSRDFIVLGHAPGFFIAHDQAITNEHKSWLPFDAVAYVKPNAPKGFYSIRYNIGQFVEHIPNKDNVLTMNLRYLVKNKTKERVIILLKRYEISPDNPDNTETANSISLFDSFNHNASSSFQTQSKSVSLAFDEFNGTFDFKKYVYFIETILIKYYQDDEPTVIVPGKPSPPAIGAIQLCIETVVD